MNALLPIAQDADLEVFLSDLEAELEVPESRYEAAERSYHSVGEWLHRPGSKVAAFDPQVYVQGSFRLGTAIKPLTQDDEYDVDAVCELRRFTKQQGTQQYLKQLLGGELTAYVDAQAMKNPLEERRRCWTLHYSDGAQFHLDLVPSIPNADQQIALLKASGVAYDLAGTAIAITDNEHIKYRVMTDDWPRSNPKGYAQWFSRRNAIIFNKRRQAIALNARASVESIPDYKVRTPLQAAIKLLKRHRDIMFAGDKSDAPISIIITTLAAHAYRGEEFIAATLVRILSDMDKYIGEKDGICIIANPSDPLENFADKWVKHPERKASFSEWLERARTDFSSAAQAVGRGDVGRSLAASMGTDLIERTIERNAPKGLGTRLLSKLTTASSIVLDASHRRKPKWPSNLYGRVTINSAQFTRNGFRPEAIVSGGRILEKDGSLRFEAATTIPQPYKVYWQIVNTGKDAERAKCLRGNFEYFERGGLTKTETTAYKGVHSIECFIIKDEKMVARSGPFLVSIG